MASASAGLRGCSACSTAVRPPGSLRRHHARREPPHRQSLVVRQQHLQHTDPLSADKYKTLSSAQTVIRNCVNTSGSVHAVPLLFANLTSSYTPSPPEGFLSCVLLCLSRRQVKGRRCERNRTQQSYKEAICYLFPLAYCELLGTKE